MITSILGAENCAAVLANQLGFSVEIVASRREGLARLRRHEYTIVVVDDAIAESDPEGAELLWKHAGLAVPLQINFAISGTARLVARGAGRAGPPGAGAGAGYAGGCCCG